MKKRFVQGATAVLLTASLLPAQQNLVEDLQQEIRRIRKELVQVQNERAEIKEEMKSDRAEFEEYRKRALKKMRTIKNETDSIVDVQVTFKAKRDSLSGVLAVQKSHQRQYELQQEKMRIALIDAVNETMKQTDIISPSLKEKPVSALKLLNQELTAKSVDNVEALNRLFTVVRELDNGGSSTQIVQGSSPIPEIRGTAYRFRLGTIFEAVVNAKGTVAAVWTGTDKNGQDQWELVNDAEVASQIISAVNVREGKALPTLVSLPFDKVQAEVKGENN